MVFEVWLSLVERYVRDVEAVGSNPVTSTIQKAALLGGFFCICSSNNRRDCAVTPFFVLSKKKVTRGV